MVLSKRTVVTISHDLTKAAYSLTLNEKRILLKGAALLDSYGDAGQMIEINAAECAEFYGMNKKSAYRQLAESVERLWDRTLVLQDGTRLRWVISCKYEEGSILLKFHPDLNPHLLDLQSRFTRYLLTRASSFKLVYTWRLFELVMQYKTTGIFRIDLDEFKSTLDIPEFYSGDFARIRVRVIEPAVKEIREKDGLKVTWKPIKKGRSVVALEFKFPVEPQQELFKPATIDKAFIEKHARPGESYAQAEKRLKEEAKKQTD